MKTDWMTRRIRKRPMCLLHIPLFDVLTHAERRHLDAADPVADAGEPLAHGQEDVREILGQNPLDLLVGAFPLFGRELPRAFDEEVLDPLVGIPDRVQFGNVLLAQDRVHQMGSRVEVQPSTVISQSKGGAWTTCRNVPHSRPSSSTSMPIL